MPGSATTTVREQTAVEETAVRFAECTEAEIDETFGHGTPDPETAEPLQAFDETIERVDGSEEEVHRERWLYCFRLEDAVNEDGESDPDAHVSEYKVYENEKYHLVDETGSDREPKGKKKDVVQLETKRPYDDNPTHFFWLSRHKLPAGRKEEIRRQIQEVGTSSFMKGVSVWAAANDTENETVTETDEGTAVLEIRVAEYGRIAEKRHRAFAEKIDDFSQWHHAMAPAKMLNDVVDSLVEAAPGTFQGALKQIETGTKSGMRSWVPTEEPAYKLWREEYKGIKTEMQSAIEERAKALIACLSSTAFLATLHHFALGDEELWAEGEALYARVIEDLTFAEAGREYLQDQYAASDLGTDGMEALKRDRSEVAVPDQVKKFNPLSLTFTAGSKITKGALGMLNEYAGVVQEMHTKIETKRVLAGMLTVCHGYEPDIVMKNGVPVDRGGHFVFEERPVFEEKKVTVVEAEAKENALKKVEDALGGKRGRLRALGALEGANVAMAGIGLVKKQSVKNVVSFASASAGVVQWLADEGLLARKQTLMSLAGKQVTQRMVARWLLKRIIVLELILGTWDVMAEVQEGDYIDAVGAGMMTGGSVAATIGFGTSGGMILGLSTLGLAGLVLLVTGAILMYIQEEDTIPNWLENDSFWGKEGPEGHDKLMRLVRKRGDASQDETLASLYERIEGQLQSFQETAYGFTIQATRQYREHPYIVDDVLAVKVTPNLLSEESRIEIDLGNLTSLFDRGGKGEASQEWSYTFSPEASVQEGHFWIGFYEESDIEVKEKLSLLDIESVPVSGFERIVDEIDGERVRVSVYPLGEGMEYLEETTRIE
ncbi:hypothetical protein BSZ35_04145 [Salinibacter sp. 10B]|uniref:hypothetical protein n=1 Tax=Salinibacter sp. 10B TaxID=1923971 RepID=UPI000CF438FA|nr:hypothetical protein [Salinibacter sp. 10B]PQJ33901.1 hypothetical protein BSZ35_04145 [Salinibacter sp. 10B]